MIMSELNFFDYFFLTLPPIILTYLAVKCGSFFLRFVNTQKVIAVVIGVESGSNQYKDRYRYVVEYEISGRKYRSKLSGYWSPYIFDKNDQIKILSNKKNPLKLLDFSFKGRMAAIARDLLLLMVLLFSVLHSMHKLEIYKFSNGFYEGFTPLVFCLLSLVYIVSKYLLILKFKKRSLSATGIIKGYVEDRDHDNIKTFQPVIEFLDRNGNFNVFTSSQRHNKKEIGAKIKVNYDKEMPNIAEEDSFLLRWVDIFFWLVVFSSSVLFLFFH